MVVLFAVPKAFVPENGLRAGPWVFFVVLRVKGGPWGRIPGESDDEPERKEACCPLDKRNQLIALKSPSGISPQGDFFLVRGVKDRVWGRIPGEEEATCDARPNGFAAQDGDRAGGLPVGK